MSSASFKPKSTLNIPAIVIGSLIGVSGLLTISVVLYLNSSSDKPESTSGAYKNEVEFASLSLEEGQQGGATAIRTDHLAPENISKSKKKTSSQLSADQPKKDLEVSFEKKELSTRGELKEPPKEGDVKGAEVEVKDEEKTTTETVSISTDSSSKSPVTRTRATRKSDKSVGSSGKKIESEEKNTDEKTESSDKKKEVKDETSRKFYVPSLPESMKDSDLPYNRKYKNDIMAKKPSSELPNDEQLLTSLKESDSEFFKNTMGTTSKKGPLRSRVFVINGNITTVGTDAIVNAANPPCLGGGGIDEAIHAAVGGIKVFGANTNILRSSPLKTRTEQVLEVVEGSDVRCPTGTARVVSVHEFKKVHSPTRFFRQNLAGGTYTLHDNTRFILQAVGPNVRDHPDKYKEYEYLLHSAYMSALNNAVEAGARHVAFNCISTAKYAYPRKEAANVAIGTVRQWMEDNKESKLKVVFVIFGNEKNSKGEVNMDFKENKEAYIENINKYFPFNE